RFGSLEPGHEIEEGIAVKAHRRAFIGLRHAQPAETRLQQTQRLWNAVAWLDVAADADIHRHGQQIAHAASRVMRMPTPCAPRSASGLFSFNATRCTSNSARISCATRSASVSTSSKLLSSTNAMTRLVTAL